MCFLCQSPCRGDDLYRNTYGTRPLSVSSPLPVSYGILFLGFNVECLVLHHLDTAFVHLRNNILHVAVCKEFVLGYLLGLSQIARQELLDQLQGACPCEAFQVGSINS